MVAAVRNVGAFKRLVVPSEQKFSAFEILKFGFPVSVLTSKSMSLSRQTSLHCI